MKLMPLAALVAAAMLAMPASLSAAGAPATKTKTLSGAVTGGGEKGSISLQVVVRKGVVKKVKRIAITVPYVCDRIEGGLEFTTVSATLPGPYKVTHINGHPNFFTPKVKIDGRTWTVGANMPNDKAKRAEGSVKVTSTAPDGGSCQNPNQEFAAT